jgi:hypothetical protein
MRATFKLTLVVYLLLLARASVKSDELVRSL